MYTETLLEKRGSGDGQRLWDYDTTERFFNAVSACAAWKTTLEQTALL